MSPTTQRARASSPRNRVDLLADLNPEQRAAVTTTEGPLLVLAGAGSGKTRVITARVAWLLAHGAPPSSLLAVTFTNRAAAEMRERIGAIVGPERAADVTIGTFHSFCARLLREHGAAIGLPPRFAICDAADQLSHLRAALRELRVAEAAMAPGALQSRISLLKSRLISSERAQAKARSQRDHLVARAYAKYEEALRRARSLDFDDLLLFAVKLLRESEETRAKLVARFRYVMVDEYQDTNAPQYELLRLLAGERRNLCVVGDDDQSIYGWRGADVAKILGFERDFAPPARSSAAAVVVVRLETNYRSTASILEAANRVIRNNPTRHEKTLRAACGEGEPISCQRVDDETAEAELVAREILERTAAGTARPRDFAVLFRAAVLARPFETALRARAIPYRLVGGTSFFDRKEVRDLLAYLRLAANSDDELSLLRAIQAPPRGVGRASLDKALAQATARGVLLANALQDPAAAAELPPAAVAAARQFLATMARLGAKDPGRELVAWIHALIGEVGYRAEVERSYPDAATREERWLGVMEVVNFAEQHVKRAKKPTLSSFLEALTLSAQEEREEAKKEDGKNVEGESKERGRDAVTLMTLHAAKGLEFPRVHLVGVEEGILPHARALDEGTVEEERRLMYVGITRAQRHLTVSCVKSRARSGRRGEVMPSRFMYEMRGEPPPKAWKAWEKGA